MINRCPKCDSARILSDNFARRQTEGAECPQANKHIKYNCKDCGEQWGDDEFYTAQELADKLKVNVMTIYRYIKAGKLEVYKIGKEFRIDKKEFNKFLNEVKTK